MAIDQHLVWACGHATMLLSAVIILIQTALFRSVPVLIYKIAYVGALVSYSIVILKSLGRPQPNIQWVQRALVDENVQYAVLALYWFVSSPVNLTVLPFATFSLFHCLTFVRQNILPKFAKPAPAAGGANANGQAAPPSAMQNYMRMIQVWVKKNYDTAMRFVAFAEIAIFFRVVVGALTFRLSFITPLFLAHFIRLRYHASPFTRGAVNLLTDRVDAIANGQGGVVLNVWTRIKGAARAWGGGRLVPQQGQAPAGAGAGAAGTAGRR